jgi:aminoglycoside phosphotransferase (APT) family kinase protein
MSADVSVDAVAATIAKPLMECLKRELDDPSLEYGAGPLRISGGNENDIFGFQLRAAPEPFDQPLVARVFGAGATVEQARREAAVHQAVIEQGLAAPRVLLVGDELSGVGGAFLIMERVTGRSGVELLRPSPLLLRLPSLLADTMFALHRLDHEALFTAVEASGLDRRSVVLDLSEETRERQAARQFPSLERLGVWLDTNRPRSGSPTITHGDLHPFNLMIEDGKVSAVLDWTRAVVAPPEYDLAANRIILRYGPTVDEGLLRSVVPLYRRWLLHRSEAAYRVRFPFDESLVRYFEVHFAINILTNVALMRQAKASGGERRPDRDKKSEALDGPNLPGMLARVERLSGIRVELPRVWPGPERPE